MTRIVAAMSGGVDSSVAAYLLVEQGYDVVGLFLRNGVEAERHHPGPLPGGEGDRRGRGRGHGCCSAEDADDARRVADRLRIPFYALDYEREFGRLIDAFVAGYGRGETPSPCVLCNQWLKFGKLAEFARSIGAEAVATGHYARVERLPNGRMGLRRAADARKDQTYFLASLSQEQLAGVRFPVGGLEKSEVREIARRAALPRLVAEKPESMEICFVPSGDYRRVIEERAPGSMRPGDLVDARTGAGLGRHEGFQRFTVGQRRGLGVGGLERPAYVVSIDPARNLVLLGGREDLARRELTAGSMCWIAREAPAPGEELRAFARIRHNHRPAEATVRAVAGTGDRVRVAFAEPQEAIAPGQALVLYDAADPELVLAGGFILREETS